MEIQVTLVIYIHKHERHEKGGTNALNYKQNCAML